MDNEKAMQVLRGIRDAYLRDFDDEVMKSITIGQPIPEDLAIYLQALRDLPAKVVPTLDSNGCLDESTFEWPLPPIWWWVKRGFDSRPQ